MCHCVSFVCHTRANLSQSALPISNRSTLRSATEDGRDSRLPTGCQPALRGLGLIACSLPTNDPGRIKRVGPVECLGEAGFIRE